MSLAHEHKASEDVTKGVTGGCSLTRRDLLMLGQFALLSSGFSDAALAGGAGGKTDVTVEDMVRFAQLGDPLTLSFGDQPRGVGVVALSPDRAKAAVVIEQGNLDQGTNDASLLVYRLEASEPLPEIVVALSSSGKQRPIGFVRWLADSEHLVFAGASGSSPAQVYRVGLRDKVAHPLTDDVGDILSFEINGVGTRLVTIREERSPPRYQASRRAGYRVQPQLLGMMEEILGYTPRTYIARAKNLQTGQVFTVRSARDFVRHISLEGHEFVGGISPDGRWALRRAYYSRWPDWWEHYTGDAAMVEQAKIGHASSWLIIDLENNVTRPVNTGPIATVGERGTVAPLWIDGGRGVILTAVFESLERVSGQSRTQRARDVAVLLLDPASGRTQKIGVIESQVARVRDTRWDQSRETLVICGENSSQASISPIVIRRVNGRWEQGGTPPPVTSPQPLGLVIEQSLNDRPVLVSIAAATGDRKIALDPNPWLRDRRLGRVEHVEWTASDGRAWNGGLYYPPDYQEGRRYPLVIQSYVYDRRLFRMDGGLKNQAARPLAAHGIMVLQLRGLSAVGWDGEMQAAARGFEGAVDHLDQLGLIDRGKVGLVGFSASGPWVGHLLAFSSYQFAAAAFTDSGGLGWWYYVLSGGLSHIDPQFGGSPFGGGLQAWLERSSTFNLNRVRAPWLLISNNKPPTANADVCLGLRKLQKPVELWCIPHGTHDLYKVKERLLGNYLLVDWFRFWLTGQERNEPSIANDETAEHLAEQYARWHELRRLHKADLRNPRPPRLTWAATPIPEQDRR